MSTNQKIDAKVLLSTLWIFVTLNYLYCDVVTLMDFTQLKQILLGKAGSMDISQSFLLGSAILMEIPIAMVILSRLLKYKPNKIANIIAGSVMTLVQISSLFVGTQPTKYYVFFSVIEIGCTAFIVGYALKWRNL
jgi:hypothetical protein